MEIRLTYFSPQTEGEEIKEEEALELIKESRRLLDDHEVVEAARILRLAMKRAEKKRAATITISAKPEVVIVVKVN